MKKIILAFLISCVLTVCSYAHERDNERHCEHTRHSEVIAVYEDVWVPGYDEYVVTCHGIRIVHHCGYWTRCLRYYNR